MNNSTTVENTAQQQVLEQIRSLLENYLEPRWQAEPHNRVDITGSTNLNSDLTLDSFQVMEFLMEIEDEMDIAIDMNSLSDVHTVADLAAVAAQQLQS